MCGGREDAAATAGGAVAAGFLPVAADPSSAPAKQGQVAEILTLMQSLNARVGSLENTVTVQIAALSEHMKTQQQYVDKKNAETMHPLLK